MHRRQWRLLPALGLLLLSPLMALAGQKAYTLKELEEIALKIHPSLQVSGAEIKKSEAELRIARQYPNPEIEGSVSSQRFPEGGNGLGVDFLRGVGGEERHVPNSDVEIATGTGAKARWAPYASPTDDVDIFEVKHLNVDLQAGEAYFAVYAACWLKAQKDAECETG